MGEGIILFFFFFYKLLMWVDKSYVGTLKMVLYKKNCIYIIQPMVLFSLEEAKIVHCLAEIFNFCIPRKLRSKGFTVQTKSVFKATGHSVIHMHGRFRAKLFCSRRF